MQTRSSALKRLRPDHEPATPPALYTAVDDDDAAPAPAPAPFPAPASALSLGFGPPRKRKCSHDTKRGGALYRQFEAQSAGGAAVSTPAPPVAPAPASAPALSMSLGPHRARNFSSAMWHAQALLRLGGVHVVGALRQPARDRIGCKDGHMPSVYRAIRDAVAIEDAVGAAGPAPAPPSAPAPASTASRPKVPLTLQGAVRSYLGALDLLQPCNPQGVALLSCVEHSWRPLAGVPLYSMSLKNAERLPMVVCGLKGMLVKLLSLGVGGHVEPTWNLAACRRSILRRVAAGMAAAVRGNIAKEAEKLCASGQCAAALPLLQQAIDLGHLPSLALKAWLLVRGREGVAEDRKAAVELACQGVRLGCHHCQGVKAFCHFVGFGGGHCDDPFTVDKAQSLELARVSSRKGSRYGQLTLGEWMCFKPVDYDTAFKNFLLAASQGLDEAQCSLGRMYQDGFGVAQNHTEALRWFQLSASQGLPLALFHVARCHEHGHGVLKDVEAARCWYRRALEAAGNAFAVYKLAFDYPPR